MAKGQYAKDSVAAKIKAALGADYIGDYSGKIYCWAKENGEKVRVAIALTCPKVQVEFAVAAPTGDFNFEDDAPAPTVAARGFEPAQITDEERERVNELIRTLGL